MLIRTSSILEFVEISWVVIIASVAVTTFFFVFLLGLGLKVQRTKPTTGMEGLIGEIGEAFSPLNLDGTVRVHGEFWQAESASGKIPKGERVRVIGIQNLKLRVEQIK
jgi:membrane-bound serine protease (ClpP class)